MNAFLKLFHLLVLWCLVGVMQLLRAQNLVSDSAFVAWEHLSETPAKFAAGPGHICSTVDCDLFNHEPFGSFWHVLFCTFFCTIKYFCLKAAPANPNKREMNVHFTCMVWWMHIWTLVDLPCWKVWNMISFKNWVNCRVCQLWQLTRKWWSSKSSIRNPRFYQTLADYTRHIRIVYACVCVLVVHVDIAHVDLCPCMIPDHPCQTNLCPFGKEVLKVEARSLALKILLALNNVLNSSASRLLHSVWHRYLT